MDWKPWMASPTKWSVDKLTSVGPTAEHEGGSGGYFWHLYTAI